MALLYDFAAVLNVVQQIVEKFVTFLYSSQNSQISDIRSVLMFVAKCMA